jgi:hypothetical protein
VPNQATHRAALRQVSIGSVFGCWTVIGPEIERKQLCRCVCGVEKSVSTSSLTRSKSTSCGCMGLHIGEHDIKVQDSDLELIQQKTGEMRLARITWAPGYIVSDSGTVYSVRRWKRQPQVPFRALNVMIHSGGYPQVNIRVKGRSIIVAIHRIVAEFFLGGKPFDDAVVRHLDGDPSNNSAVNLAWGTQSENRADSVCHGTALFGERVGSSKLSQDDISKISILISCGIPHNVIAKAFGVTRSAITDIASGKTWGKA